MRQRSLYILFVAIVLAVTALSAVGFFAERVEHALSAEGSAAIAADLVVEQGEPIPADWIWQAQRLGLETSRMLRFPTVLFINERPQLVQIKAVEQNYPLRGRLLIRRASEDFAHAPLPGEAATEPRLARLLGEGQTQINLGRLQLKLVGQLLEEPDLGASLFQLVPRLLISWADAHKSGLLGPASRAKYRLLSAGPTQAVRQFREWLRPRLPPGAQLLTPDSGRPELNSAIERARRFLSLAALCGSLLAGVAILLAARDYLQRSLDEAAILRTIGISSRRLLWLHLRRLLLIGLLAALVGAFMGWGLQQALGHWLGGDLGAGLPSASWRPVPAALGHAALLLLGFALPSLWVVRGVPPLRVLRRDLDPPRVSQAVLLGLALSAWLLLVYWQINDAELALNMGLALVAVLLLFAGLGWLLLMLLNRWRRRGTLPFGLFGLVRQPGLALLQLAGFGMGLSVLLLLGLVRHDLIDTWRQELAPETPNHFLINIQADEAERLSQRLRQQGIPSSGLFPSTRARLTAINNASVRPDAYREARARRLASREYSLGFSDVRQSDNRVISGRWWRSSESAFSVEAGVAGALGIKPGDILHFDVAGQHISAPVLNLRTVEWDSFNVNFFVQGSDTLLKTSRLPYALISSIYLPEPQEGFLQELSREFPGISAVSIGPLLDKVRGIVDRGSRAVEAVFLFALGAALLVSVAALHLTRAQREREIALLRTLGASRRQVRLSLLGEFGMIGLLAGVAASAMANGLGIWLGQRLFGIQMSPAVVSWVVGPVAGVFIFAGMAWLASRPLLSRPPIRTLR